MRTRFLILGILALLLSGLAVVLVKDDAAAPVTHSQSSTNTAKQSTPAAFNKHRYSTQQANSLWVIVNKPHGLNPSAYVPNDLVVPTIPLRSTITGDEEHVSNVMAPALEQMAAAAKQDGVTLNLQSGYRSYNFQVNLYNSYVKSEGQAQADQESARPGHSEHQTGLAADIGGVTTPSCNVAQCFADTTEGKWLAAHAYEYGFVIRYPAGKEAVTGYEYEPWHVRYVGSDLSQEMHRQGVTTLEEFFGVSGGASYN
jgi:D-alanyl-D-alanine carboxypeptidase